MSNNYRKLIKELRKKLWKEQGIASYITGSGHIRFDCPLGRVIAASSSGCGSNTIKLVRAQLRRMGAEV